MGNIPDKYDKIFYLTGKPREAEVKPLATTAEPLVFFKLMLFYLFIFSKKPMVKAWPL